MRCPECSRERTKVRTARTLSLSSDPIATYTIIAVNVAVFLAEGASGSSLGAGTGGAGTVFAKGALLGPAIAHQHEYWRLVTSGFLHAGFLHLFFNMLFLYFMGPALEREIGRLKFVIVYFVALLGGSFGALLFQPDIYTVGASGAAFGVLAALVVVARARRIPIWSSGLGPLLAINLVFSLSFSGISIGGHLGGLIAGGLAGALIVELGERRRMQTIALVGCAVVAVISVAGAIAVAGNTGIAPNGIGLGG
jgi:membrane associated rhomboid family serine protease